MRDVILFAGGKTHLNAEKLGEDYKLNSAAHQPDPKVEKAEPPSVKPPALAGGLLVLRYSRLGKMPPALYGTQILAEANLPVVVFEFDPQSKEDSVSRVEYPRVRKGFPALDRWPHALRSTAVLTLSFLTLARWIVSQGRPRLVIAHGPLELNLAVLLKFFFRIPYGVHVHEVYDYKTQRGLMKWTIYFEGFFLRLAEFTIFPEINRQRVYRERYRLKRPSLLVFNTPRRRDQREPMDLRKHLGISSRSFLVLYMGGVDHINAVDELVRSLCHLPSDVHVVITGWVTDDYKKYLLSIVSDHKLEGRVHLLGVVEPSKWPYIDAVDAAFCGYRNTELRTRYLATASNKISEAISAGVPVILLSTPNFQEFLDQYPVGVLTLGLTAPAIAEAIKALHDDPMLRMQIRDRALHLHQSDLNYDFQFRPVLDLLKKKYFG